MSQRESETSEFSQVSHVTVVNYEEFIIEEDQDGDLYIPFNERFVTHPTNDIETLMHVIKGSLCSGILAIPRGFKYAGLGLGFGLIIFIGSLITYCIHMLIKCEHILCQRVKVPSMLYPDVLQQAFHVGPVKYRKYAKAARLASNIFLVADLFLSACVSVVFLGTTLESIMEHAYPNIDASSRIYMGLLLFPLILINMIGKLKYMAPLSMLANLLMMSSIVIVLVFLTDQLPKINTRNVMGKITDLPAFTSAVIFAIQCIGVTLSLENNMKNPKNFISCPGVMYIGMFIIVFLNTLVGFLGYWKYGEDVMGNLILNLPQESSFAQVVRYMTCFAIFLTHSLQMFVPIQVISHKFHHYFQDSQITAYVVVRVISVTLSVIVAVAVPNFFPLVGFIGAVSLCALGFAFPAIIECLVYYKHPGFGIFNWRLYKNLLIMMVAVILCFTGSYVSVRMIFDESIEIH